MRFYRLLFALPLLISTTIHAQESPSVTVGTARTQLRIKLDLPKAIPSSEVPKLKDLGNYKVYELVSAEALAANIAREVERINGLPDGDVKKRALENLAATLKNPLPNLLSASPPDCRLDCARITLNLASALGYDKTYVLKIAGVVIDGNPLEPVEFKLEKTAAIAEALNASNTREELRIRSTGPLAVTAPGKLSIQEKTLRINAEGTRAEDHIDNLTAVASQPGNTPNLIEVKLDQKLNEAQAHILSIPGSALTDGTGVPIAAKGTITIPGLSAPPDDPTLSIEIATNAAVGQKPQFDFDVAWAPYKKYHLSRPAWFWQPVIKADLGLGDTKSDNAITLALLAHYSSNPSNLAQLPPDQPELQTGGNRRTPRSEIQLRTFYRWRRTPWYQLGSYDFFVGPKMEADRAFHRINALGTVRFDFRFHRWVATIDEKRKLLKSNLGDLADLVEINNGFRVIPYLSFDFGGNVRNETVENTDKMVSITVPRHPIFRSNLGLKGTLQWRLFSFPMTLTLEERLMHLALHEDIAFETDEGVGFRSMRGFHHHGEAAWNLAFDPAKHYNFTITYENGRSAPNFEYLNKVSTGFKIIF